MNWEIINTRPVIPRCALCDGTTDQMAAIHKIPITLYICSNCGRFVKDCMNSWKELKSHTTLKGTGGTLSDVD